MNSALKIRALCPRCGLCCNGVLFADVRLKSADDSIKCKSLGLPVRRRGKTCGFVQPCVALNADGRCGIYEGRPEMCRQFECGVLKQFVGEKLDEAAALAIIGRAQKLAARVRSSLEACGNSETHRPLTKRFQKVMRQPIDLTAGEDAGERRGELMMAVHELMKFVQKQFLQTGHPGDGRSA